MCWRAARGGHLHVLQWARAHGCPWDSLVYVSAFREGHFRVMQWAKENGCPWAGNRVHESMELVEWGHGNGME